jgi:hypothetical protein
VNREIVRMNLTGLEPELVEKIRLLAESTILTFDGFPENARTFQDAGDLLVLIAEVQNQNGKAGR